MHVEYRRQTWKFEERLTVYQLLKKLNLLPGEVLVICNGKLVTEDHHLEPGNQVKIVPVISGG